jgi:hypothetical protein
VALVGLATARTVDLEHVDARLAAIPASARDALVRTSRGLAMLYVGALDADLFAGAPLNTDDRPVIEFLAPRMTRMTSAGDKDWFTGERLAAFSDDVARRPPAATALLPASDDVASASRAGLALFRYALAAARHDETAAAGYEADVRARVPDVIATAESLVADGAPMSAGNDLATLRLEQVELRRQVSEMERRLADLAGSRPAELPGGDR